MSASLVDRRNVHDLDEELSAAREAYAARHPKSRALHDEAAAVMPGGNTRTTIFGPPFPIVLAGGEGAWLTDVEGGRYRDFLGEYTAGLFGHSHPVIRAAIDRALDQGILLGGHGRAEIDFATAVTRRFPAMERVRFTNSGTEANLMAVATTIAITGRRTVIAAEGGYHGGLISFGDGASPTNAPYDFVLVPYNDAAAARAAIAAHAGTLAAVLVEPMQGSGGCIPGEMDFLTALRDGAAAAGALLILDEVMTSRLAPHGLGEALGIRPDLMTLGKYVGGGMSFGAFGGRAEVMDRFDPRRPGAFVHGGTFNNNQLTMAAGHAGLTQVFTDRSVGALHDAGEALRDRLNAICRAERVAMQFTGRGSMMSAHMVAGPVRRKADTNPGDIRLRDLFWFDLLEAGFWIARRGMINLSLVLTEADHADFTDAVAAFVARRAALLA